PRCSQDLFRDKFLGLVLAVDDDLLDGALAHGWHRPCNSALLHLFWFYNIDLLRLRIEVLREIKFLDLYSVHNNLGSSGEYFIQSWGHAIIGTDLDAALLENVSDCLGRDRSVGNFAAIFDGNNLWTHDLQFHPICNLVFC